MPHVAPPVLSRGEGIFSTKCCIMEPAAAASSTHTHGTAAKNRPVTLCRQQSNGKGMGGGEPSVTPPPPAPHHNGGVLGGAGDDVVVVGAPVDVQHWRRVPRHQRVVLVHTARLQHGGRGGRDEPGTPPEPQHRYGTGGAGRGETEAQSPIGMQRAAMCPGTGCCVPPVAVVWDTKGGPVPALGWAGWTPPPFTHTHTHTGI